MYYAWTLPTSVYNVVETTLTSHKVVIFGVTDPEGSSVAHALLEEPGKFRVIGICGDVTTAAAIELKELGVELKQSDLKNPASYKDSLKGADGVFLSTDYWTFYNGDNLHDAKNKETALARSVIDQIKNAKVGLLVYSTLESCNHEIPHFESKSEITGYIKEVGIPSTQLYTSTWYSDILHMPVSEIDGKLILHHPLPDNSVIPSFAVEQIGLWAMVAFKDPKKWIGQNIYCAGENVTVGQVAECLSEATGKHVETLHRTREEFLEDHHMDRAKFLEYLAMLNGEITRGVDVARQQVPYAWDLKTWIKHNSDKIHSLFNKGEARHPTEDVKSARSMASSYQSVSGDLGEFSRTPAMDTASAAASAARKDLDSPGSPGVSNPGATTSEPEEMDITTPAPPPTSTSSPATKTSSRHQLPKIERRESLAILMQARQSAMIQREQAVQEERRSSHDKWLIAKLAEERANSKIEKIDTAILHEEQAEVSESHEKWLMDKLADERIKHKGDPHDPVHVLPTSYPVRKSTKDRTGSIVISHAHNPPRTAEELEKERFMVGYGPA